MRILSDGGVLVAATSAAHRFDAAGNVTRTYTLPGTNQLFALNLDIDGTSFWIADYNTGLLYKVDIESGTVLMSIDPTAQGSVYTLAGILVYGEVTANDTLGHIAGTKYYDSNNNGVRDAGEPGLSGWSIVLSNAG